MKKDTFSKIGILALFVIFAVFLFTEKLRHNEIKKHGKTTICKLTLCKQGRKSSEAFVKYYINGKKYRTSAGQCPDEGKDKVNRFFSMKYDNENPNNIVVDFSSEVNDSTLINELEEKLNFSMYD